MNLNISEQPLNTEASVLTTNILNERNSILPEYISAILPLNYDYSVSEIQQLPVYITTEGFAINQFEANLYVNINNVEDAHKWFCEFEEISKTTMPQSKGYNIQGKKVIFREIWHCIYSNMVRQKQGNPVLKKPNSMRIRNTGYMATIHLRLECWHLQTLHPLEINIKFIYNHVIHSAKSLSFRHVKEEVCNKYIELFTDRHSPATALYAYEDNLYLRANHDQELMQLLADHAQNPDYGYVLNLFKQYRKGYAVFQKYDSQAGKAFILCIVTNLMIHVHEKIQQSGKICYVDALASFEPLNTSITLLYTSCISEALPLGLLVTSDELEATLKRGLNLLKTLLPQYAFFGCGPNVGPMVFLTDDSSAECNALDRKQHWALLFRSGLLIHGNNTNNYVEYSFGLIKDIIFSCTKAYNSVQVFQFITTNMEQYYEHRLLGIAHSHPGHLQIARRFLCPGWEAIDAKEIQQTEIDTEYLVPSQEKGT
ncbi:23161_t:CDS:2, partial [Gigaspora margarita]